MNLETITETKYHLVMNEDQASWLKAVMQNPLHGDVHDEAVEDRMYRATFWDALSEVKA